MTTNDERMAAHVAADAGRDILMRLVQLEEHLAARHPRASRDAELASIVSAIRDEASALTWTAEEADRPVWIISRGDLEALAGRDLDDEEVSEAAGRLNGSEDVREAFECVVFAALGPENGEGES
jgi:hypothetical protein